MVLVYQLPLFLKKEVAIQVCALRGGMNNVGIQRTNSDL
jgi:hypothetical protein